MSGADLASALGMRKVFEPLSSLAAASVGVAMHNPSNPPRLSAVSADSVGLVSFGIMLTTGTFRRRVFESLEVGKTFILLQKSIYANCRADGIQAKSVLIRCFAILAPAFHLRVLLLHPHLSGSM